MAVSKSRSFHEGRPVAHAGKDDPPSGPPGPRSEAQSVRPQRQPMVAAVAFAVWATALIGLAVLTANPITLNYAQIAKAPLVVEGAVESADAKERGVAKLRVHRSWPAGHADEVVVIDTGERLPVASGQSYLVPLEPIGDGRFRIVPTPLARGRPTVYPANPDTIAQLNAILSRE